MSDDRDYVLTSFAFSTRNDGTVHDWLTDNAVGVVLADSFEEGCHTILSIIRNNTDWHVDIEAGGKPLRMHLTRDGKVIGVLSGWSMRELIEQGTSIKHPVPVGLNERSNLC